MPDVVATLFAPRIRVKELAQLCRRLATSLSAGVDMRSVWKREASGSSRVALRRRFAVVRDAVAEGRAMADGFDDCGDFFPELFRQLARVGEETGSGAEVLRRLAEHYESQLKRRRIFLAAITWPLIQLIAALFVIGIVIWIMGMIGEGKTDILGFGLIGSRGLSMYLAILSGIGIVLLLVIRAFQRGMMWIRSVQRVVLRLPAIGPPLETLALSRIAWVMNLTMNTGMDVRQALRLTLSSTNQARYLDQIPAIDEWIDQGGSIYEAFVHVGSYPPEFLDALHVGEESGSLAESMGRLSEQYEDRARMALAALMTVAGFLIWAMIAMLIIYFIFRIFSFYLSVLSSVGGG
ncbi:MAG TPA: type II secretion system F family protein [Thermoguttaceae bacterium]|nr:type II secretion system F family protein [Thermoguttaceae bacterium]